MAEAISTPAVVVDIDVAARNIGRFQAYADAHGLRVRPHIKTHKLPAIAEMQLGAGAIGITCQKISEAEAMVAGSAAIRDVLITYNIVGDDKLAALRALAGRVEISVVADNPIVVDGLSAAFAGAEPLTALVECNVGADRCGVGRPTRRSSLRAASPAAPGLVFGGLMTYPPAGGVAKTEAFMAEAEGLIESAGCA